MENNPASYSMTVNGGDNSGNFSVGDDNKQVKNEAPAPAAMEVSRLIQKIHQLLETEGGVRDRPEALSALGELTDDLDGPNADRPSGMRTALSRLQQAIGKTTAFTVPLAQLSVAIEQLIGLKP
jgi:hypothetical protein